MYNPVELAMSNIWKILKPMELGNTFTLDMIKFTSEGDYNRDVDGNILYESITRQGYVEKVAPYGVTIRAMIDEYGANKTAIGIKYLGGQTEPYNPDYNDDAEYNSSTFESRRWAYKLKARFAVMCAVMRKTKASASITSWDASSTSLSDLTALDMLQDINLLLEGKIVTPWSTPLRWLGHQTPVELDTQSKPFGAVLFGTQYESTISVPIMQPVIVNQIENITFTPYIVKKGFDPISADQRIGVNSVDIMSERE